MALLSNNPISSLFSLKNLVLSMSVLFISLILKLCIPFLFQIVVTIVPMLWFTFESWFTPPYLYVVINFIIIAIALSSRFHHKIDGTVNVAAPVKIPTYSNKESCGFVKTATCKTNFEVIEPETEVKVKKEQMDLEKHRDTKTMKKAVEVKSKVEARKTDKYVHFECTENKFEVKEKMETRGAQMTKMPIMINSTEFASRYSPSQPKDLVSELVQQSTLQAENDTLEDTWNMIMEKHRVQNAGLQEASHRV